MSKQRVWTSDWLWIGHLDIPVDVTATVGVTEETWEDPGEVMIEYDQIIDAATGTEYDWGDLSRENRKRLDEAVWRMV